MAAAFSVEASGQSSQTMVPVWLVYVPASQGLHLLLPGRFAYLPTSQNRHLAVFSPVEYLPTPQFTQSLGDAPPGAERYFPAGQFLQRTKCVGRVPDENLPGGQMVQLVAPAAENLPATHRPHSLVGSFGLVPLARPAGHCIQSRDRRDASISPYLPAGHG